MGGKRAGGADAAGRLRRRAGVSGVIVTIGEGSAKEVDVSVLLGLGLLSSLKNPLGVSDPDEGLVESILMLDGLVFSGVTTRAGASFFRGESEVRFQAFEGEIMENPLPKIPDISSSTESLLELLVGLLGSAAALAFFGCFGTSTRPSRSWLLLRTPGASSFMVVLPLSAVGGPENQDVFRRFGLAASGS